MKKIAILGTESSYLFEEVVKFFKNYNLGIEITCLYEVLGSPLAHVAVGMQIKSRYLPKEQMVEYFGANSFDLIVLTEYKGDLPKEVLTLGRFINLHQSLLPAFKGEDAIQRAILAGVKVTGATVHWVTNDVDGGKIVAQYPVLIENTDSVDDVKSKLNELSAILYPVVINSILEDKVFDFGDLFANHGGCGGNCGGCGGCH